MTNRTGNDDSENLSTIIRYFNININLFYLIFGNIGNLLKISFFLQKPLRSLPCTVYILFATISDLITLNNLPARQLLVHLYPEYDWIRLTVDWSHYRNESLLFTSSVSTYDIIMCKMRSYIHMLSIDLSSQMLLFASINRFFFSYFRKNRQKNKNWYLSRMFCHFPIVYRLCLVSCLICAVISVHHIFNFTILSPSEGCAPRSNTLWTMWILSIHCFLLPITMIIFGMLTLKNLRHRSVFAYCIYRRRRRIERTQFIQMCSRCIHCRNSVQHRIDNQLTAMIITEIIVTVFSSIPHGAYAFYHLLHGIKTERTNNSSKDEWVSLFIRMSMYFEASCGFYIYLITLTTLRKRFWKMFIKKITSIHFCT